MMFSGVVGDLPPGIDDRSFSHLDYAVASTEPCRGGCLYQVDVSPLQSMVVNIVGDLAEQHRFLFQYPVGFPQEWRIGMREVVAGLGRRFWAQPEPCVKVLLPVFALVGNVWWIVDDHVKRICLEW